MAIKVNMSKAYDKVVWEFMLRASFREHWVQLLMRCAESSNFFFIINSDSKGVVIPREK